MILNNQLRRLRMLYVHLRWGFLQKICMKSIMKETTLWQIQLLSSHMAPSSRIFQQFRNLLSIQIILKRHQSTLRVSKLMARGMSKIWEGGNFLSLRIFHKYQTSFLLQEGQALFSHKILENHPQKKRIKFWSSKSWLWQVW